MKQHKYEVGQVVHIPKYCYMAIPKTKQQADDRVNRVGFRRVGNVHAVVDKLSQELEGKLTYRVHLVGTDEQLIATEDQLQPLGRI